MGGVSTGPDGQSYRKDTMSFVLNLFGLSTPPLRPADKPHTDSAAPAPSVAVFPGIDAGPQIERRSESDQPALDIAETPVATVEEFVPRQIRGAVDGFQPPGTFAGWALVTASPGFPVTIQILACGQQIGASVTSYRSVRSCR